MAFCPNCGCEDKKLVWQNSSGEVQCDNCGYSEEDNDNDAYEDN